MLHDQVDGDSDGEVEGFSFRDDEVYGEVDPSKRPSRPPSGQNKVYFIGIRLILDEIMLISSK